jgi:hypothetical protein
MSGHVRVKVRLDETCSGSKRRVTS